MSWTNERVAMLRELWAERVSASQIAGRLGSVTRNAVIGKVHRLGLSGRATTTRAKKRRPRIDERRNNGKRAAKTTEAKKLSPAKAVLDDCQPLPPPQETDIARVTFDQMADDQSLCKWGVGDPKEPGFGFCGMDRAPGLPYCTHHVERIHQMRR